MAEQYRGVNEPYFMHDDFGQVVNGGAARANTPRRIAANQTWLGYRDVPAVNFFSGRANLTKGGGGDDTLTESLRVLLPPGCTHVEFWFLVVGLLEEGVTQPTEIGGLKLISQNTGDYSLITSIPNTYEAKYNPSIAAATWVAAKGVPWTSPFSEPGPRAVKCREEPVSNWSEDWVSIVTTREFPGVVVFSAYYRAVAPEGELKYDDGTAP